MPELHLIIVIWYELSEQYQHQKLRAPYSIPNFYFYCANKVQIEYKLWLQLYFQFGYLDSYLQKFRSVKLHKTCFIVLLCLQVTAIQLSEDMLINLLLWHLRFHCIFI